MPILDDIMDHKVLGRERKRGMELGGAEGQRGLILGLLSRRFGPVPDWAVKHLDSLSTAELEPIALRLLDAQSIEDLLGQP